MVSQVCSGRQNKKPFYAFNPETRVNLKPRQLVNTVQPANLQPRVQPAVLDTFHCMFGGDVGLVSGGLVQFSEKLTGKRQENTEPQLFPVYADEETQFASKRQQQEMGRYNEEIKDDLTKRSGKDEIRNQSELEIRHRNKSEDRETKGGNVEHKRDKNVV